MIKLFSTRDPDESYTFLGGKKYTVGRKNSDIVFPDDKSISREHAEIEVDHPRANLDNPSLLPTLTVTDVGSRFKTYINEAIDVENGVGISTREPVSLVSGDRIRFGRLAKEFRVDCTPLVVTGSTLKDAISLKDNICKLGGHFIAGWSTKCDYVVMDAVTLTIKAVCALLAGKYIVSPNYFTDLVASIEVGKKSMPDPMSYTPPLVEAQIQSSAVDFRPDPERSMLFAGKTFVFYNNKQLKKLGCAVTCGGGTTKLISECSSSFLASPDTLMLQPPVDAKLFDSDTKRATEAYKRDGKRFIQESEISLAAVYVHLEKHCNPLHDLAQNIFNPVQTQTQTQRNVLPSKALVIIPETQEVEVQPLNPDSRVVVEESFNMTSGSDKSPSSSVHSKTEVNSHRKNQQLGSTKGKHSNSNTDESLDPPSTKRRLELESETQTTLPPLFAREPTAKRQKNSVPVSQNSTILSKTRSKNALSAIFGMDDSDPEDDDDEPSIIPATFPLPPAAPQPPADSVVHQSSSSVVASNKDVIATSSSSAATPFVDFVPGTPDMSEEEDDIFAQLGINVPEPESEDMSRPATSKTKILKSRSTRSKSSRRHDIIDVEDDEDKEMDVSELPTVKIPTLPTAQQPTLVINPYSSTITKRMNGKKTVAVEPVKIKVEQEAGNSISSNKRATSDVGGHGTLSAWLTSNKRKTDKDEDSDEKRGTSKKIKTNGVSTFDILNQTKQMKLEDSQPDRKDFNPLDMKPAPVQVVSLLRACRPDFGQDSKINVTAAEDGSPRNFKRFQRVIPLSLYNSTVHKTSIFESDKQQSERARVPRKFIPVNVNDLPEQKVVVGEKPHEQENFDIDPAPSTSRNIGKESEGVRRSGRGRKKQGINNNTPVEVVCDVDVHQSAILTPSERFEFKTDVGNESDNADPSDGMFDFD